LQLTHLKEKYHLAQQTIADKQKLIEPLENKNE
jgi:hypothetical protein